MYKLHHFYLKFLYCLELIFAILKGSGINSFFLVSFIMMLTAVSRLILCPILI